MLRHYAELKAAQPERVLLYRLGDFFENAKRRSLESEQRTKLLDEKLRNDYELESRLKHGKSSSPTSPSHPRPTESSSSKSRANSATHKCGTCLKTKRSRRLWG